MATAKEPWEMNKNEFYDWYAESNRQRGDRAPHVPEAIEYAATINDSDVDALYKQESEGKVRIVEHKGTKMYLGSILSARAATENLRESMIERSLSEGKPVPPEVLMDYPDLQATYEENFLIDNDPNYYMNKARVAHKKRVATPVTWKEGDVVEVEGKRGVVRYVYTNGFTLVEIEDQPIEGGIFNNTSTFSNDKITPVSKPVLIRKSKGKSKPRKHPSASARIKGLRR